MAAAKILGKGLGAFEPCGRLARTEGLDPFRRQMIDDAIGHIEHDGLPQAGHAGIARRNEKRCEQRTLRKRDGDGMFASAGTEKKNVHDNFRYSRWRTRKSHKSIELKSGWL